MVEDNHIASHQAYLDTIQKDIEIIAGQTLNLVNQLKSWQEDLGKLVNEYQRDRYNRQVEIWAERGLTRCTNCFDIPNRNWGLIPPDDTRYIEIRGSHTHRFSRSHMTHRTLEYHRLCTPCYTDRLKAHASAGGGLSEVSVGQADEINTILAMQQEDYQITQILRERFGSFDEIRVYWHNLPIPEQNYEIGKTITLDDDYKNVLRLISLKP